MEFNFEKLAPFVDDAVAIQANQDHFSVWGAVKGLAMFGVGMAVLGKASELGAGQLFKQVVKNSSRLAEGITESAGKDAIEAGRLSMGGLFRGVRDTLAKTPMEAFGIESAGGKKVFNTLSRASVASQDLGKFGNAMYNRLAASPNMGARAIGGAAKAMYHAAPMAAGWYGISRALGLEHDEDDPRWYNIPGHMGKVAKMTAEFAAFDVGMLPLKKLGGFAKKMASDTLSEKASPGLHAFFDKHFAITRYADGTSKAGLFAQRVVRGAAAMDGLRSASNTFSGHVMDTFMRNWGAKSERDAQHSALFEFKSKSFRRQVRQDTVHSFKTAYKARIDSFANYRGDMGHDQINFLSGVIAKNYAMEEGLARKRLERGEFHHFSLGANPIFSGHGGKSAAEAMIKDFNSFSEQAHKTVGSSVLHRQEATVGEFLHHTGQLQHVDNIFHQLSKVTESTTPLNQLKESFYYMAAGKNIYKSHGNIIDYSHMNPKNLLSAFTKFADPYFTVGFMGRELPLMKIMGINHFLASEGMGMYSMRANEGHKYYDKVTGEHGVGEGIANQNTLGGILINGKLWNVGKSGVLQETNTAKMRMVHSEPYARESVMYKLNARQASNGSGLSNSAKKLGEAQSTGFSGMVHDFAARWGFRMPEPLESIGEKLNQAFSFSPMRKGVDRAIDLLLNPKNTIDSVKGDLTPLIGAFGQMGQKSSAFLYRSLSDPRMLDMMGRLTKDVGGNGLDRFSALKKALHGTDDEVMEHIRTHRMFETDEHLRYALEHHDNFGSYGMTDQLHSDFSFRERPLTKREEINRRVLNQTLGMQNLPQKDNTGDVINVAKEMLKNNETLKNLSSEEVKHLKMMSTHIDLFHAGYLDGSGRISSGYSHENVKADALNIIQEHFKTERNFLTSQLFDTKPIKDIGVLGFGRGAGDKTKFSDIYQKEYERTQYEKTQRSPFILMDEMHGHSSMGLFVNTLLDRVMDMGNFFGLRYNLEDKRPTFFKIPELFNKSIFGKQFVIGGGEGIRMSGPIAAMSKRVAQGVGVLAAAQALDTFTDSNPLFSKTIFAHGVYSAAADVYVRGSMAFHKVQDMSGLTEVAKHLEGLMPSSMSTIPGMVLGGISKGPLGIIPGAVINRFMAVNGVTPSFDKSYSDMKEVYSGRELVPIRRNRFWMFSKAPFEGDAPEYFRPHWYPRLKSDYKHTDTLYGSKSEAFLYAPWAGLGYNPIAQVLDKYHYERKHYWDRPYPVTTPAFSEVPVLGKILSATIGRLPIIGKPLKHMHEDEMSHYFSTINNHTEEPGQYATSSMPQVSTSEQLLYMAKQNNVSTEPAALGGTPQKMNPYGVMTVLGEQLYNFTELAGLKGYQLESFMGGGLGDTKPRLQGAGDMWSARRAYWDMNAGDILGSTEFFRRFVPREKKVIQHVNPLRNKMESWLPSEDGAYFQDFLTGDPYTKIQEGEMRLPGDAYNRLYNVKRAFPGRASALGGNVLDLVKGMTGLEGPDTEDEEDVMEAGTAIHRQIQNSLLKSNIGIKAEQMVYDAKHDISGHIDLIMYDPYRKGGKRVLEIKTVNSKKFNSLRAPIGHHVSQVNFYLKQMHMDVGTLLYINRDDLSQIRTFDVRYNEERLRKDTKDLDKARQIAAGLMSENKGFETGASYSWLDRLRILSDVAPYSEQYKDADKIIKIQIANNMLTEKDKAEVQKIRTRRKSVMRKVDLYPTRFRGKVFNPDINYQLWSENTDMKAAAEYSFGERVLGSIWERGIQMDTPLNMKLWNYKTPLQHYKSTKIYGSESAAWNRPIQDILHPMMNKALATNNPIDSAAAFGWIGALGMGGMGNMAVPGAVFGSLFGAAKTVVGDDSWIPDEVNRKREIDRNFDRLKYERNTYLYQMTGDQRYQTEADNTMWNIASQGYQVGVGQAMRAMPAAEKSYFLSWMNETNPLERQNILSMVPEDVGNMLKAKWGMTPSSPSKYEAMIPNSDWEGLLPSANLDDMEVKTINQEGLRANDFGLGWYDQQRRMANSQFDMNPISDTNEVLISSKDIDKVKGALLRALSSYTRRPLVAISMNRGGEDKISLTLNLRRNRFNDIKEALKAKR